MIDSNLYNTSKKEKDIKMNEYKQKFLQINIEIQKQTYSLEYFWRCLVFYLGSETEID